MKIQSISMRSLWSALQEHSYKFLVGGLVAGVAAIGSVSTSAYAVEANTQAQPTKGVSLPDGVYLYGQSPNPDQIGKGYFVFEVNRGTVVGALYMPRSSFDCASGSFRDRQMALTVVNSYDRTSNPFDIALETSSTVAAAGDNPAFQQIGLQGFHQLTNVSENDYRMLNICKADYQKKAH